MKKNVWREVTTFGMLIGQKDFNRGVLKRSGFPPKRGPEELETVFRPKKEPENELSKHSIVLTYHTTLYTCILLLKQMSQSGRLYLLIVLFQQLIQGLQYSWVQSTKIKSELLLDIVKL